MDKKSSGHHLVPFEVYYRTIGALMVLTVLTVAASYIDFGKANIFVSMGIATFKAMLVLMFFMGLRYDTWLNRVVIASAFASLALFLGLTASDLWTRAQPVPVKVAAAVGGISLEEFKKYESSSADTVAKGKELFATNCTVCHGVDGNGDGPAGAALNPKPRNFHGPLNVWKNGTSGKSIYVTLSNGIPNTGMGGYKTISPKDRWALVHFIRTMVPGAAPTGSADAKYDQVIKDDGAGGTGGGAASIPVDFAIDLMAK